MATSAADELLYDPFVRLEEPELYEVYEQLREECPVYRTASGWWVVSRYGDAREVLNRPDLFSSSPNQDELAGLSTDIDPDTDPEHLQRLLAVVADMPVDIGELLTARMIIGADPPTHTRMRSIVNRGFTPRRVADLAATMERIAAEALAGIERSTSFDVVARFAEPLPARVISEMLGVDRDRWADMKRWADTLSTTVQGTKRMDEETQLRFIGMLREFAEYFVPLIARRRKEPGGDLISALVRAEEDEALSEVETILFIFVLMFAGSETAANVISNTVVSLYRHPDQLDELMADPELALAAVDESLRFQPPFQYTLRKALSDTEIAGTAVRTGDIVVVQLGAANRDPRQFRAPDRFDIRRASHGQHLSLGHGLHYCLGAHLGRMEAKTAIGKLLPHLPKLRLAEAPLERLDTAFIFGWKKVELVPERGLAHPAGP